MYTREVANQCDSDDVRLFRSTEADDEPCLTAFWSGEES